MERNISGQYRLDPNVGRFFGAQTVHFRQVENAVLGRFGRYGTLRGSMDCGVLRARWKNDATIGWVVLRFDESLSTFQGEYGTYDASSQATPEGTISAKRDVRKRAS
jgi:hypothetical protein